MHGKNEMCDGASYKLYKLVLRPELGWEVDSLKVTNLKVEKSKGNVIVGIS